MTTFLTTTNLDTIITNHRDNLGGTDSLLRLQWYNYLNHFLYPRLIAQNPNDYLTVRTIKTISDIFEYALPSDYQDHQAGGLFQSNQGDDVYGAINYDAEVAPFTVGETLTGGTSGATGTIVEVVDYGSTGTIRMTSVSGTFQDDEQITDSSTGDATANGTAIEYNFTNRQRPETEFGSRSSGYWLDSDGNLVFTPIPKSSQVFTLRYIPEISELTAGATTVIPIRFKEFVQNSTDIFWEQYRQNSNLEFLASQRFQSALIDMMENIRKTPHVMKFKRTTSIYGGGTRFMGLSSSERR